MSFYQFNPHTQRDTIIMHVKGYIHHDIRDIPQNKDKRAIQICTIKLVILLLSHLGLVLYLLPENNGNFSQCEKGPMDQMNLKKHVLHLP